MGLVEPDLPRAIVDALFLLPQMTGDGDPLPISGVRGWISSHKNPYANRVGLKGLANFDRKIAEIIGFFREYNKGFTFVAGPEEIAAGLGAKLCSHGLKPAQFHSLAGMYCEMKDLRPHDSLIAIEPIELDRIENSLDVIARSYGMSPSDVRAIYEAKIFPPILQWELYLAYLNNGDANKKDPIGFGASSLIENDSILLLRGSGVLPEYRKRGIYRELTLERMALGFNRGVEYAIVQAARNSSYGILRSIGFREVCSIEWYEWSPTFDLMGMSDKALLNSDDASALSMHRMTRLATR